jgi:hypothetical protein
VPAARRYPLPDRRELRVARAAGGLVLLAVDDLAAGVRCAGAIGIREVLDAGRSALEEVVGEAEEATHDNR